MLSKALLNSAPASFALSAAPGQRRSMRSSGERGREGKRQLLLSYPLHLERRQRGDRRKEVGSMTISGKRGEKEAASSLSHLPILQHHFVQFLR